MHFFKKPLPKVVKVFSFIPYRIAIKKEFSIMVKKVSMAELIKKNTEELLKDKSQLEIIEKRIDQKYIMRSEKIGGDK